MDILRKIIGAGPQRDLLTDASLLLMRLVFGLSMALAHAGAKSSNQPLPQAIQHLQETG